ncbi:hypothetical protein [Pseudonocardia acaciae]|uniref:hypothetical protein n=1 Tax=Pseudonocardia acaciae TaxID=551276 RepID=UPI0007E8CE67|nr:hypothetical protein [Pseudonocardia acaciae]
MTRTDHARPRPVLTGRWGRGLVAAAVSALVVGVPTDVLDNPYFTRMTPVRWWDYAVLAATALLTGLWAVLPGGMSVSGYRATGASLLGSLAVGCPMCNKLVMGLLGLSGALAVWAPLQPLLAVGSVVLILVAVVAKWRTASSCPVPRTDPGADARPAGIGEDGTLWPLEGWDPHRSRD